MKTSFEEFKALLVAKHGEKGVRFREVGQHGWSSIESADSGPGIKMVHGQPGPHWCGASPIPPTQKLLGSYDFITGTANFFFVR